MDAKMRSNAAAAINQWGNCNCSIRPQGLSEPSGCEVDTGIGDLRVPRDIVELSTKFGEVGRLVRTAYPAVSEVTAAVGRRSVVALPHFAIIIDHPVKPP